nr:hypothetical protein [Streptomyces rimosus]
MLAPSTLAVTCAYLSTPAQTAVADGIIARNPCERVRVPRQRANKALTATYVRTGDATWVRRGKPEGSVPARVEVPDGASLHDLRHFYASLLIKHRENVKTVQK